MRSIEEILGAEVAALPAGPELDALIAERLLGWRRVQPPTWDYDGPLPAQGEVLVPPGWNPESYKWPNRGLVGFGAILDGVFYRWSRSMANAWDLVTDCLQKRGWEITVASGDERWSAHLWRPGDDFGLKFIAVGETAPLAICRAALMMVASADEKGTQTHGD